jgi:hypothetical protein
LDWPQIETVIRKKTPEHNVAINVEAANHLFDLVRPRGYKAYEHDEQRLRTGVKQEVYIGLRFYLVDGERLVFQFPQPRAQPVFNDDVAAVMLSIMHHAYATGDYADADVELADLSAVEPDGDREPRIRTLARGDVLGREELNTQIEAVYEVLRALANRKFDPDEPTPMGF